MQTERRCPGCNATFVASRRSNRFCSTKCRVKVNRKAAAQAREERNELTDLGDAARSAIYSISGIGQLPSDALRARGTLKAVWIAASEGLLELGVTREMLRELLIK